MSELTEESINMCGLNESCQRTGGLKEPKLQDEVKRQYLLYLGKPRLCWESRRKEPMTTRQTSRRIDANTQVRHNGWNRHETPSVRNKLVSR